MILGPPSSVCRAAPDPENLDTPQRDGQLRDHQHRCSYTESLSGTVVGVEKVKTTVSDAAPSIGLTLQ